MHASLSEDEGVVSESIGTWPHDKIHQSGAPGINSQGSRRLGSPRSLSENNMPAEMAWPFFAIEDVTRSGLAAAAP